MQGFAVLGLFGWRIIRAGVEVDMAGAERTGEIGSETAQSVKPGVYPGAAMSVVFGVVAVLWIPLGFIGGAPGWGGWWVPSSLAIVLSVVSTFHITVSPEPLRGYGLAVLGLVLGLAFPSLALGVLGLFMLSGPM